jgi:Resolvase, N terminal domain
VQIGYMRVSKADGSQSTDLERDALGTAGVATRRLYEDRASGRLDARPGLDAALKALRRGHPRRLEARPPGARPAPPHQHRSRPQHARHRPQGAKRPRCVDQHHHAGRQAGVRHLRRTGGIRARPDFRANQSWPGIGPRARMKRRGALQDDGGESAAGHGRHGTKGNEGDRFMQRTGDYPANALPACRARWDAAQGWAEGN